MTAHTPGPWRAEGWEGVTVNAADGCTILACPGASQGATLAETKANARLIAAAPDLLAALEEIAGYPHADHAGLPPARARAIARTAIAKATG